MGSSSRRSQSLDWQVDVAILTEPLYLVGYVKAIAIVTLIMGSLMTFLALVTDNVEAIGAFWIMSGLATLGLIAAGFVGTAVLTGNRLALHYKVDRHGVVQSIADRKLRAVPGVAAAAGALAGNAGAAGAGLLARSQNRRAVDWNALASARFHPHRKAVSLRNSWRTLLIVFCTDETYEPFAALVEQKTANAAAQARSRRNPVPGFMVRTVIAVLCSLPFFILPYPFELDLFAPLLTLGFVLASVWLVPHLVVVSVGALAIMWVEIGGRLLAEHQSSIDGSVYRAYDVMFIEDWIPLALAATGTIGILALGWAMVRGRYPTALSDGGDNGDSDDGKESRERC